MTFLAPPPIKYVTAMQLNKLALTVFHFAMQRMYKKGRLHKFPVGRGAFLA